MKNHKLFVILVAILTIAIVISPAYGYTAYKTTSYRFHKTTTQPTPTPCIKCPEIKPCPTAATCPTMTPYPTCEPCIVQPAPTQIIKTIHKVHYDVMVIDGIDQSAIEKSLLYLPNYYEFSFVVNDPSKYIYSKTGVTMPRGTKNLIVVSSDKRTDRSSAIGYSAANGNIGIIYYYIYENEPASTYDISVLIAHELAEQEHIGINSINILTDPGFNSWKDRNNVLAMTWYDYLLSKVI